MRIRFKRYICDPSPYFNAVTSTKTAGLLKGLADGSAFNPNQPITRQEMAVVFANIIYYRGVVVSDADLSNFTDLDGVSAANLAGGLFVGGLSQIFFIAR